MEVRSRSRRRSGSRRRSRSCGERRSREESRRRSRSRDVVGGMVRYSLLSLLYCIQGAPYGFQVWRLH